MESPPMVSVSESDVLREPWRALQKVSITKFLDHDKRPAFITDLSQERQQLQRPLRPIYINAALYTYNELFVAIAGRAGKNRKGEELSYREFLDWAKRATQDTPRSTLIFAKHDWEATDLDERWRVFIATPNDTQLRSTVASGHIEQNHGQSLDAREFFTRAFDAPNSDDADPSYSSHSSLSRDEFAKTDSNALLSNIDRHEARSAKRNAELLAKIAGFGTMAIFIVDIDGKIIFCNNTWYEIFEAPRHETNAMLLMEAVEDDERARLMEVWRRVNVDREAVHFQFRLKRRWKPCAAYASAPENLPTWISAWGYPDVTADGKSIGWCGLMTDISEQKWAEHLMEQKLADVVERASLLEELSLRAEDLVNSEARFRRLADMMPCGIWVSNEVGKVLYANSVYNEIVPGSCDPSRAQPWWDIVLEEDMTRIQGVYRRLLEENETISFEVRVKKTPYLANTELRWITVFAYPERYEDGRLKHITGCLTDISHLKLAEELQHARTSDALEAKRQLEHFIDMTSHEMRNPLSAIIHSAEEIITSFRGQNLHEISTATIANIVEAAETIIHCTDHSTRIVDDILLVSKLDSGLLSIFPTVVQPIKAIKQALRMFDGEMRAADITQSFTIDQSFDQYQVDWVFLDASRVRQIFVNLITNAVKFTRPENTRRIDTFMKASLERPTDEHYLPIQNPPSSTGSEPAFDKDRIVYITISVTDTGCGLTEAEHKNLFQRFSQAGKRTHVKYGGTGLGLFISRQLCEMQGGQIGLQSTPQKGSVFSFYVMAHRTLPHEIPLETPEVQNHSIRRLSAPMPIKPPVSVTSLSTDSLLNKDDTVQPNILLVEDNLINQKVVAKKLSTQGYSVIIANHGLEALDRIRESSLWFNASDTSLPISLVLLDLEMPVMDGLTCIRRIREMERLNEISCHIPVIAITANARQDQINQAKEYGMDDVITKPFRVQQLFTLMTLLMKQFPTPSIPQT